MCEEGNKSVDNSAQGTMHRLLKNYSHQHVGKFQPGGQEKFLPESR